MSDSENKRSKTTNRPRLQIALPPISARILAEVLPLIGPDVESETPDAEKQSGTYH
jgi:hypothetical protein